MTRRNRRRHALAALALAVSAPVIVVVAVASRHTAGAEPADVGAALSNGRGARDIATNWTGASAKASLRFAPDASVYLTVDVDESTHAPDVLVYWTSESPGSELPADSRLLGVASSHGTSEFALPTDLHAREGALVLYSLAHGEVIGWAGFPAADSVRGSAS